MMAFIPLTCVKNASDIPISIGNLKLPLNIRLNPPDSLARFVLISVISFAASPGETIFCKIDRR